VARSIRGRSIRACLGGFDVWEMDAAMYREYCLLVRYQRQAAANPML